MERKFDVYAVSWRLRVVAHVLHYAEYIQGQTDDADFYGGLIDVSSDYLYWLSEQVTKLSNDLDVEMLEDFEQLRKVMGELSDLKQQSEQQPTSAEP